MDLTASRGFNDAMPILILLCAIGFMQSGMPERTPLSVTIDWLAQHLDDANLVVVHTGDRVEYDAEHIPGALYLPLTDIATPMSSTPMFELLPPEELQAAFERLGANNESRFVVYFGKNQIQAAARILFTLDYMGFGAQSSLLDGGMPAWRGAGKPLTAAVRAPARGKLTLKIRDNAVVDAAAVQSLLNKPAYILLDARLPNFYKGESPGMAARAGHIPGAVNLPYTSLFDQSFKLKSRPELEALFREAGVKPGTKIVAYCHIGQTASLVYIVARYLGFDASLYDGSFTDWSSRRELPVEK